ncbi:MAG: glycosyltransferase family 4 protein [Patescibacteria group bacterium]
MRIAVVVSTFPPYRGGMGNLAAQQAAALARLGHQVDVFTPIEGASRVEEREGYTVHFLRAPLSIGNAAFLPQLYTAVRGADLIFLHYPFLGGAEAVALARRMRATGGRLAVYYHMDLVGQPPRDSLFTMYTRLFLPWIVKSADRLIVSTFDYAMTGTLAGLWGRTPADRLVELAPAVDTDRFAPGSASVALRERLKLDPNLPLALFVGGLDTAHYFKGLEVLLRAVAHVNRTATPLGLVVVGEGDLRSRYEAMAHTLGVVEQVRFVGNALSDELPDFYRLADFTVLSSIDRSEAFGLVVLEAMASGKAVVASRLPGVRTVVEEGRTGLLVEPANVQELAAALARLAADPAECSRMGAVARTIALEQYALSGLPARLDVVVRGIMYTP